MNLAEIRQKAQQTKTEEQPASGQHKALEQGEAVSPPGGENNPNEGSLQLWHPSASSRNVCAFDPLAVLLAGRANAGCDEEDAVENAAEEPVAEDYQEFLCFRVSNELYAINIMEIKEIIKPREITEVPRVPTFVSGVISLRGIIIPVFNMHERLGLSSGGSNGKERIIVVKKEEEFSGLQVDEVIQVVRIADGLIEQPPAVLEGVDREFVNGVGRHDGKMLILLNLESILDLTLT